MRAGPRDIGLCDVTSQRFVRGIPFRFNFASKLFVKCCRRENYGSQSDKQNRIYDMHKTSTLKGLQGLSR